MASSLRRGNVLLRASWTKDAWQPALSVLYNPIDQGRMSTASLSWQGHRVQLQGSLRAYAGPVDAVVM